jgi:hypothetical protein
MTDLVTAGNMEASRKFRAGAVPYMSDALTSLRKLTAEMLKYACLRF